eukprot:3065963-Pleurochrysis_carterae.AAC.1
MQPSAQTSTRCAHESARSQRGETMPEPQHVGRQGGCGGRGRYTHGRENTQPCESSANREQSSANRQGNTSGPDSPRLSQSRRGHPYHAGLRRKGVRSIENEAVSG